MRGSCLCGHVTFAVDPPLRDVVACHCTQCRKTSGHFWAATSVPLERFHLLRSDGLRWFQSSSTARRGFCGVCGASLFWEPLGEGRMAIAAGALDGETGLTTSRHIFVEDAGDYYAPDGPPPAAGTADLLHASCLCGANRFALPGPMGAVTACHCSQCRKLSGHFAASFDCDEAALVWVARRDAHYRTPGGGTRGHCADCGSSLWFRDASGAFSVEAGVVDAPTGGQLAGHIFVADKGDYYSLTDGLPGHDGPG